MTYQYKIFGGSSNLDLTGEIAKLLNMELGKVDIKLFADKEIGIQIGENVRGCDVFLVQSTSTPVNDHLMELLLMIDACKRASASRITAVIPYYGYARQDRKTRSRVPISAALVARLIESAGADRVLSVDLHCGQIQGFFKNPFDNLYATQVLCAEVFNVIKDSSTALTVVSPDAGGVERADYFRSYIKRTLKLDTNMAIMSKKRAEANKIESMELVGCVKDTDCIIVDDIVDTAGTLVMAAKILKENGAKRVFACATHGLLNSPAVKRIEESCIEKLIITNTVPLPKDKESPKIMQVSIASSIAEAIRRVHCEESLSIMFQDDKN